MEKPLFRTVVTFLNLQELLSYWNERRKYPPIFCEQIKIQNRGEHELRRVGNRGEHELQRVGNISEHQHQQDGNSVPR